MPDPEIAVNSTNDILKELLAVTKNIQSCLIQKTDQKITQEAVEVSHQSEDSPEIASSAAEESPNIATATMKIDNISVFGDGSRNGSDAYGVLWTNERKIAEYRDRRAKHKSECEKMQVAMGCFIAHLQIVGDDKEVIEDADSIYRDRLLAPVQYLEKVFEATPDGRPDAMRKVRMSFDRLQSFARLFYRGQQKKYAQYYNKVNQWARILHFGYFEIAVLVRDGKLVNCLEFIHDDFFSELETAMCDVVEALTTLEVKSAGEWLATQKIGDYEKWCAEYMTRVFPRTFEIREPGAWPEFDEIVHFGERLEDHKILCYEMWIELDHLVSHYIIIGGDKAVIDATNLLKKELLSHAQYLENAFLFSTQDFRTKMRDTMQNLLFAVIRFQSSLYHQKHAFYFREVKQWVICLWIGVHRILSLLHRGEVTQCMSYMQNSFLPEFGQAMIGKTHGEQAKLGVNSLHAVPEELKTFGKESLPKFLVDQMERDTTRYVNLTTIATFFSSVTATTLQFMYAETDSVPSNSLRGVVNLFWFLSLVFSVSSGVSSLLGLTWRKSSIYDTRVPPKLIRMWFDKAPMLFLIIAAVFFVIGLNLFSYLSIQPRYVSFATNILTGMHGVCLLAVTTWFIYHLKHESIWAGWVRSAIKPVTKTTTWIIKIGMTWLIINMTWLITSMKCIWKMVKWPYEKYEQNLHLQRNIYWAFEIDNRVAHLNYDIDHECDWSDPYLLSKFIRRIAIPIKRCWSMIKKALSNLGRTIRAHVCVPSPTGHTIDDVEMGENVSQEEAEASEESLWETVNLAKNEFRRSLQIVFSDPDCVDRIMQTVQSRAGQFIENDLSAERWFSTGILWGYPDLVKELFDVVGTAYAEAFEKSRRQTEEMFQRSITMADEYDLYLTPEVEGLPVDDSDNTAAPARPSPHAPLNDGSGHLVMTHTDAYPDSQGQLVNHPPSPDEPLPAVTPVTTEALKPTCGDTIPQLDIAEGDTMRTVIEKVPFTSMKDNEGSCITQSSEESGE